MSDTSSGSREMPSPPVSSASSAAPNGSITPPSNPGGTPNEPSATSSSASPSSPEHDPGVSPADRSSSFLDSSVASIARPLLQRRSSDSVSVHRSGHRSRYSVGTLAPGSFVITTTQAGDIFVRIRKRDGNDTGRGANITRHWGAPPPDFDSWTSEPQARLNPADIRPFLSGPPSAGSAPSQVSRPSSERVDSATDSTTSSSIASSPASTASGSVPGSLEDTSLNFATDDQTRKAILARLKRLPPSMLTDFMSTQPSTTSS